MLVNFSSLIPGRLMPKGREPSLPGDKYNRLTLLSEVPNQTVSLSLRLWLCRCNCGTEKVIPIYHLKRGTTGSCGCLRSELVADRNATQEMFRKPAQDRV